MGEWRESRREEGGKPDKVQMSEMRVQTILGLDSGRVVKEDFGSYRLEVRGICTEAGTSSCYDPRQLPNVCVQVCTHYENGVSMLPRKTLSSPLQRNVSRA